MDFLPHKCCFDNDGNLICSEGPCDDCGKPCEYSDESGCVSPSNNSNKVYRIIYSGAKEGYPSFEGSAPCIIVLQPIDPYTGDTIDMPPIIVNEDNYEKNYVKVDPCPSDCICGWTGCWEWAEDMGGAVYFVEYCGKAGAYPDDGSGESDYMKTFPETDCVVLLREDSNESDYYQVVTESVFFDEWMPTDCRPVSCVFPGECAYVKTDPEKCGRLFQWEVKPHDPMEDDWHYTDEERTEQVYGSCFFKLWKGNKLLGSYHTDELEIIACCDDDLKMPDLATGEPMETLYVELISSVGDNTQNMQGRFYEWDCKSCQYYPANRTSNPLVKEEDGWKLYGIDGREYKMWDPNPHNNPDDKTYVFSNKSEKGKPWLTKHYEPEEARIALISARGGHSSVKILETPTPGLWSTYFNKAESHQQIFLANLTKAAEALGSTVILGTKHPDSTDNFIYQGVYDLQTGDLTLYIDSIKEVAAREGKPWLSQAVETLTHECVHLLQDWMGENNLGDAILGTINIRDAEGIAEAERIHPNAPQWFIILESEAHSLDDTLEDFQSVLNLMREEILNYYDY